MGHAGVGGFLRLICSCSSGRCRAGAGVGTGRAGGGSGGGRTLQRFIGHARQGSWCLKVSETSYRFEEQYT